MLMKYAGAVLVILGCSGTGFAIAAAVNREIRLLRRFLSMVEYMLCELNYKLTPLPQLCSQAANHTGGELGQVMLRFSQELDKQITPDAGCCLRVAVDGYSLPPVTKEMLLSLGDCLGQFDLTGQLSSLESLRANGKREMEKLQEGKEQRQRSYKTLGVCAGAALTILLL